MTRQALLQTPPGSLSDRGVTGVNITPRPRPPVPALMELKVVEPDEQERWDSCTESEWTLGLSSGTFLGRLLRCACVSPMPSLGFDIQ